MNVIQEAKKFAKRLTGEPSPSYLQMSRAEKRRVINAKPVVANHAIEQQDCMPLEVANAMLFGKGVRLTNAMRKNCMAARETVFVSTREGKEYSVKLTARAKKATAAQLVKWANRVVAQRAQVTRDYLKLSIQKSKLDPMKLHEIAKANRYLALMDIEAQRLDAQMNSYRTEAEARLLKSDALKPVR